MGEANPRIPHGNPPTVSAHPWRTAAIRGALALAILGVMYGAAVHLRSFEARACVVVVACAVFVAVLGTRSNLRKVRRTVAEHDRAHAAMLRGELGRARDVFRRIARTATVVRIEVIARHNLAWATMRLGDLPHAAELWADNEHRRSYTLGRVRLAAMSAIDLALCHALMGDLTAAEAWLATAEQRAPGERDRPEVPELLLFARAVIDCRAQRCAEAARRLDEGWARCEASLVGATLRAMRVIRGFAVAADGPRSAGLAASVLANMRPAYAGELDFLGVAWPEMASFLAAHALATRPEPSATAIAS